jgi:hypothetical protein
MPASSMKSEIKSQAPSTKSQTNPKSDPPAGGLNSSPCEMTNKVLDFICQLALCNSEAVLHRAGGQMTKW